MGTDLGTMVDMDLAMDTFLDVKGGQPSPLLMVKPTPTTCTVDTTVSVADPMAVTMGSVTATTDLVTAMDLDTMASMEDNSGEQTDSAKPWTCLVEQHSHIHVT